MHKDCTTGSGHNFHEYQLEINAQSAIKRVDKFNSTSPEKQRKNNGTRPGHSKTYFSRFFAQSSKQSYVFQIFENHKNDAKVLEEVETATKYKKNSLS